MRLPEGTTRNATIALSLLAAGFLVAYLRLLPYLEREATWTDGRSEVVLADLDQLRYAVWDAPAPLSPVINGPEAEGRATISPDGRLMVFTVGEAGLNADLWVADVIDGEPVAPRPLTRLNSPWDELSPVFASDALWFATNRPGGEGDLDLVRAPYADGLFEPMERLPPGLNSEHAERDPAPLPGSRAVVFAGDAPRGRRTDLDLYLAVPLVDGDDAGPGSGRPAPGGGSGAGPRGAGEPAWRVTPLAELNSAFDERDPAFSADGRVLLLASDRDGGAGGLDLYRAVQAPGDSGRTWLDPEPLKGVNGPGDERAPVPTAGGFGLLLASSSVAGEPSDLHRATSVELYRVPGRPVGWLDLTVIGLLLLVAVLAWLGKRWEALDILAKCILLSLLAHMLLMLWFQEVVVDNEPVPVEQGAPSFRVRLTAAPRALAASTERAGRVQATPAPRSPAEAPGRAEPAQLPGARATAAAREAVSAPDLPLASPPSRDAVALSRDATPAPTAIEVREAAPPPAARLAAQAPTLTLSAASAPQVASVARRAASAPSPLSAAPSERGDDGAPVPVHVGLALPSPSATPAPSGPVTPVDASRRASVGTLVASLPAGTGDTAPEGAGAGRRADAPLLDLGDLAAASSAAPARGAVAPGRLPGAPGAPGGEVLGPSPGATALAAPSPGRDGPTLPGAADGAFDAALRQGARDLPDITLEERPAVGGRPVADAGETAGDPATGRDEGAPALALAAPKTLTPSRRGAAAAPPRPGRWDDTTDTALTAATARPASRPLGAGGPVLADAPPDTSAREWEHTPYRTRFGAARTEALRDGGGNERTERAVAAGLAYLARTQRGDGYWGHSDDYDDKYGHVSVGKTALCLLAFLGAGHSPNSAREHADVARRAADFLLAVQDDDTGHFGYTTSYSHATATYALSEAYALDRDERYVAPLERAVAWILEHQNRERDRRRRGGWGYYYPDGRSYDRWPRTSVSTWQVMALESARLAGLDVPDAAFSEARRFLMEHHDGGAGVVLYSRDPERLSSAFPTLPGSTPAGLFALSLLGEDLDDERWTTALDFLSERRPGEYRRPSDRDFVFEADGNLYFWYYATLVLFRVGGERWETWNEALQASLLPSQRSDGSWPVISIYAGYAGDDGRDRAYTTAMNVLSLEVYYRYFTPLLQVGRAGPGASAPR